METIVQKKMLKVVGASWLQTVISFLIVVGISIFGILLIVVCRIQSYEDDGKYAATIIWNSETERYDIVLLGQNNNPEDIDLGIARAYYQPDMQETGWAVLEIESNGEYSDEEQAYASGILEGSLSWQHIYWQWKNTVKHVCTEKNEFCNELRSFLERNTEIVRKKAKANDKSDPFWHQVNLFYSQLDGIEFGWRYEVRRNKQSFDIPSLDFLWLNIVSDLKDFQRLAFSTEDSDRHHSSAAMSLLKIISMNQTKFLVAHASSGFYSSMLRIQKKYHFNYHMTGRSNTELVPGRTISFTSYPGSIHSQDDFYQIQINAESKVTVVGTALLTVGFEHKYNENDYQVLLGPRVMAGNRLSKDGRTWTYYVGKHSSGTGNKQWLHIKTKNNNITLWVLEQTPQKITSKDETELLSKKGYWINCGISYYNKENADETIMHSSEMAQHHVGNVSLKNIIEVLEDGQKKVFDVQSLVDLMRGPELALAGRADLHSEISLFPQTRRTNQYKSIVKPSKQVLSHRNDGQMKNFQYVSKNGKFFKSSSMQEHNFTLIYNSSWLNLYNLKNKISFLSSPFKKTNTSREKASVRHSQILHHSKQLNNNFYRAPNKHGIIIKNETNSAEPIQSGQAYPLRIIDGIIDLKLSDSNTKFLAAAGPPYNLQSKVRTIEPFQWSKSSIKYLPHDGHSDIWKYDPVEANFVWL